MSRGVAYTRICRCGHDQGRHDLQNRCLVRGCACVHCETVPDLRTKAGKAQAQRQVQAQERAQERPRPIRVHEQGDPNDESPTDQVFAHLSTAGNTPPASDSPPCRFCGAESSFLLIAYRQPGWPTTPLCQPCLLRFERQAVAWSGRQP